MKNMSKFKKTANVFHVICRVGFWISLVGMVVLSGISFITNLSIVSEKLHQILMDVNSNIDITINLFGWSTELSPQTVDINALLSLVTTICIVGVIVSGLYAFLFHHVGRIMNDVKTGTPFTQNVVRHTYFLTAGVVAYGIVSDITSTIISSKMMALVQSQFVLSSATYSISGTTIITGILLFLLAKIFQYGAFLQEEYDTTI